MHACVHGEGVGEQLPLISTPPLVIEGQTVGELKAG